LKYRIKIITGNIKSGKTTYLQELLSSLENVAGVIQVAEGNRRFFVDLLSGEKIELTSQNKSSDTFKIGNFIFRKPAFIWAKEKLRDALKSKHKIIAIDEFGLLELHNEGLEPVFSETINKVKSTTDLKLIIIIRESLLKDFLKKFDLNENEVEIEVIKKDVSQ